MKCFEAAKCGCDDEEAASTSASILAPIPDRQMKHEVIDLDDDVPNPAIDEAQV